MSRTFLNKFIYFNKYVQIDSLSTNTESKIYTFIYLGVSSLMIGGHGCYAYGTAKNKMIVIDKKYKFTRNGFTEFMIIDKEGHHYNVNNSMWYWKWDSIEDWCELQTSNDKDKDKILIKYYGLRIPMLGIFPTIIMSAKCYDYC